MRLLGMHRGHDRHGNQRRHRHHDGQRGDHALKGRKHGRVLRYFEGWISAENRGEILALID